jgi:hypothetical protein
MRTRNQQRIWNLWEKNYGRSWVIMVFLMTGGGTCFDAAAAPVSGGSRNEMEMRRLHAREGRVEAENRKRAFPLGHIPDGARARALAQIEAAEASSAQGASFITPKWYNIGPTPMGDSPYAGPGLASGRVAALAVDPSNAAHWLLGAAQGGIWETTDSGLHWTARTDNQASLAMGAMAFAPSNPSIVYAGTGEPNFRGDDYAGAGLLISSDGGTSWGMRNSSFAQSSFSAVRVHATDPNRLSVATLRGGAGVTDAASGTNIPPSAPLRGIHISANGGTSFTRVLTGEATDLQVNPGNFSQQYGALGEIYGASTNGVYRTLNGWTSSSIINGPWTALATPTQMGRIAMAISPSDPNTLYVAISQKRTAYLAGLVGIWRTANAWATTPTWTLVPNPPVFTDGDSSPRFWYHFSLLVDRSTPSTLYLCEFDIWRYAASAWSQVPASGVHPDNHVMAWVPAGGSSVKMLLGNDGGVWLSGTGVAGAWQNLNAGLGTLQIYKGATDPTGVNVLGLGGTQDNGTASYTGSTVWDFEKGGDGADCAISASNPSQHWAVSYQEGAIYRTKNGGGFYSYSGSGITGLLPFYTQFFVHFEKSPRNDDVFIAGTSKLWRCNNFFSGVTPTWTANSPVLMNGPNPVPISAMAFAPADGSGLIYAFGGEDGQLRITFNGGGAWSDLDPGGGVPNRYVSGLAFSPTNSNVLYVTLSGFDEGTPGHPGHLFKTANANAGTPTWVDLSPPVNLPNNCIAIGTNNPARIFVGTDIGLWESGSAGSSWTFHGPSHAMPNVAVFDVRIDAKGGVVAFTHGRGAYRLGYEFNPPIIIWDQFACKFCPRPPCLSCPFELWADLIDPVIFELPLRSILPIDTEDLNVSMIRTEQITPLEGTQKYGALAGQGAAVSKTFSFQVNVAGQAGGLSESAVAPSCGDTIQVVFQLKDRSNDLGQITVPFRIGRPSYPLLEDSEQARLPELPKGWISSGAAAGAGWNSTTNPPPNTLPRGEEEDAVFDEELNVSVFTRADTAGQTYLISPTFTVGSSRAQLYFQQAFELADPTDGGVLEIAIGTQSFQDILQAGGEFVDDGYNTILSDQNPLGPRPAWSGDSGGWVPVTVNLPPRAAGQPVRLRWQLATARGLANGFWFLDSILVTEPFCPSRDLVIVNPLMRQGRFTFGINTETSHTYFIECKTNLTDAAWQFLQSIGGDGNLQTIVVPATGGQRFYRFRRQ